MPKLVTMLGDYDGNGNLTPTQAASLVEPGKYIWPGGLALVTYIGLKMSGFRGSVLWLGPIAGAIAGARLFKTNRQAIQDNLTS